MKISAHALVRIHERIGITDEKKIKKRLKKNAVESYADKKTLYIVTMHGELPSTIKMAGRAIKSKKIYETTRKVYCQKLIRAFGLNGMLITVYEIRALYSVRKLKTRGMIKVDKKKVLQAIFADEHIPQQSTRDPIAKDS